MPGTPPTRFVYLGPEGTFAEQALRTLPAAERGIRTPARSVPEAMDSVRDGDADAALVPLENSVGGAVTVTLDELATGSPLVITREVVLPVEFQLAAPRLLPLTEIRSVAAHPQASTQCRGWLAANLPDAAVVDVLSNAAAAISTAEGVHDAAVCAPIGVPRNGLVVLADKIADRTDAVTRFALVTRPAPPAPPTGDDLTSLAVSIRHDQVGALLAVLTELAVRGINLTRIESRPTGERLGTYVFFLDCSGHVAEPRMGEALQGLRRICAEVRFLGSFAKHRWSPAAHAEGIPGQDGLSDADFADSAAWLTRIRDGRVT
ncbi:prephenate dehydratase [Mangrovihabitans endophyticus]|uniref:Prephenate dehydratase n=1 Tax=Mangrovihabitans endophyticus TaxID=1751298 RepID=A0A8J3C1A7_9ACTN|nr:prephenate dehydratase [Mangrovihabitans endophyticus]GGK93782.1 prephenate dehydratase [Mangrovihabitans endophyticus]